MTIDQLWRDGARTIRRDPWADGNYLELRPSPLRPDAYLPFGVIHSPLEADLVPDDVRIDPLEVGLWTLPQDGWEAYTGPIHPPRRKA